MGRFTVHGSVELHIQDRILYIEGAGPWNIEAIKETQANFTHLIEQLRGAPWAALVVLKGDPIYVPDAADYLVEVLREETKMGRVASAILIGDSTAPEFAKRHISDIYQRAEAEHRFFSDQTEATWWLVQKVTSLEGIGLV